MAYTYETRVRYGECDQQGVVFNSNYMVYMDDAAERWASSLAPSGNFLDLGWDWMVVKSIIEWQGSARHGEILTIEVAVVRYGNTSLDFGFVGTVAGRPVFRARNTCVSIRPGTTEKCVTPEHVRALLGEAAALDVPA
jgi:acyl-CoA thioester hydrolase